MTTVETIVLLLSKSSVKLIAKSIKFQILFQNEGTIRKYGSVVTRYLYLETKRSLTDIDLNNLLDMTSRNNCFAPAPLSEESLSFRKILKVFKNSKQMAGREGCRHVCYCDLQAHQAFVKMLIVWIISYLSLITRSFVIQV